MPDRELTFVRPEDLDEAWPHVEHLIAEAAETTRGRLDADDYKEAIRNNHMQLWIIIVRGAVVAATITEIINYPQKRVARWLVLIGAGRQDWYDFKETIEQWARESGCTAIEAVARKGWARIAKDYDMSHVFIEKEL